MSHYSYLCHAALTDVGRRRKNNEDSFGVFPGIGVFCVADGMGGGDDGEGASAAVVRAIEVYAENNRPPENVAFSSKEVVPAIGEAVSGASKWIFDRAAARGLKGCGSTFVGVCFDATKPSEAKAMHAGDSRLYRIRGKSIKQITKDHSAAEMIGAKNEDEVNPMFRGMILRAVGTQPSVELEVTPFDVREHDAVLICSDGLYRMVPEKKMVAIVRGSGSPKEAVASLIAAANEAGGIDNVTAVLVEVGRLPAPLPVAQMSSGGTIQIGPEVAYEEPCTGDTSTRPDATFDVATVTSSTISNSIGQGSSSTKSTVTIPEEDTLEDERLHAEASCVTAYVKKGEERLAEDSPSFFRENRLKMVLCVCAVIVAIAVAVGVAAEAIRLRRLSIEAEVKAMRELAEAECIAREEEARKAAEKAEAERVAKENARIAAEKAEAERIAKEKARIAAEEAEKKRQAEEDARKASEKAEAERRAKEKAEEEARKAAEKAEAERVAAEKARKAAEEAEKKRQAEEAARKAAVWEKARHMLEDASFYCESGDALSALQAYAEANKVGYVLTKEERDRVRDIYSKKADWLNKRILNKRLTTESEREQSRNELAELDRLFRGLKSEGMRSTSSNGVN